MAALYGKNESTCPMSIESGATPWRQLLAKEGGRLLLFARQQTRSEADAQDVLQEAFLRIWKSKPDSAAVHPGEVYTAIRRTAVDLGRQIDRRGLREAKTVAMDQAEGVHLSWFDRKTEQDERRAALESAIRKLPGDQQEVLILKIWGNLTFDDIGKALGLSANTAASRYRYSLTTLRRILNPKQIQT